MLEDTVIIFSSDNGGMPFGAGFNYPFRGAKGSYLEGGVRVPAFVYGPKYFPTAFEHHSLFHIADFLPTLMPMIMENYGGPDSASYKALLREIQEQRLDGIDQRTTLVDPEAPAVRDRVHIIR